MGFLGQAGMAFSSEAGTGWHGIELTQIAVTYLRRKRVTKIQGFGSDSITKAPGGMPVR
jgi:hypothetical protein